MNQWLHFTYSKYAACGGDSACDSEELSILNWVDVPYFKGMAHEIN
jgi:hypothetical protein